MIKSTFLYTLSYAQYLWAGSIKLRERGKNIQYSQEQTQALVS